MRFRAERDTLLETLVTAGRASSTRSMMSNGIPALQLSVRSDQLEAVGSDPDLVIEARCDISGDLDGTALLPARLVTDIVRSFEPGAVRVSGGEDEVRFCSGRAEFVVRVAVGAEITRLGLPEQEGIQLPAAEFAEGLRQVVRAALADDSRAPQLTGVLMVPTQTGLRLIATDSYRLAFRDFDGLSVLEADTQVLVPAKALAEVQRLIAADKDGTDEELVFRHGDLDAVFDVVGVRITTRLLRGQFPDVERLVPTSFSTRAEVDREQAASALRRVRLLVRDSKDVTTPVRVSLKDGGIEFAVLTPESGRAVESVEGKCSGEDVMVAFNPGYLLEGIEAVRAETMTLEVNDPGKPAMIRGEGEDEYRYVLMPVKVS